MSLCLTTGCSKRRNWVTANGNIETEAGGCNTKRASTSHMPQELLWPYSKGSGSLRNSWLKCPRESLNYGSRKQCNPYLLSRLQAAISEASHILPLTDSEVRLATPKPICTTSEMAPLKVFLVLWNAHRRSRSERVPWEKVKWKWEVTSLKVTHVL